MNIRIIAALSLILTILSARAERTAISLNRDWSFRFSHQVDARATKKVSLPHTWNAQDALSGKIDYKRGIGNYERRLMVEPQWKGKRLWLRFEGANSVADVFVNGKHTGEHRGGYSAFVMEITDKVKYGEENTILVRVNNGERLDVMPLVGDFNFYGGLYRGVSLLITEQVCINPDDFASPGVYLVQKSVDDRKAHVDADVLLANSDDIDRSVAVNIAVCDADGREVCRKEQTITIAASGNTKVTLPLDIARPHLWNGVNDPYLYTAEVTLQHDGKVIDRVVQPLGLRSITIHPQHGFLLNGKPYPLHGVCRHQDRPEIGNALRAEHHAEDMRLISQMGANAIRLAHYQHSQDFYDLADRYGMVVWAEIPFVGPGGYADKGFVDSPDFRANGEQQLSELIRQNFNHPAICMWGLFNEIKESGDNPVDYVKHLNALAHAEDTTRPTTAASNQGGKLNFITDLIAWNRYDGWYGSTHATLAQFLDATHTEHPQLCIGISEYGAGASIYHQQEELRQPVPSGYWHPENWQTYYHIENYRIIAERKFVWGSFVWNMFDFGAAHRTEGDRNGINDKGLVTFDRKTPKDAYYFYKANWNPDPMVYISERRLTERHNASPTITVFANVPQVQLVVNGKAISTQVPDSLHIATWQSVQLQPGSNTIQAIAKGSKTPLSDTINITLLTK